MGVFEVDLINVGLDLRDPRDTAPSSLPAALNVIPTGGVLRTVPGYRPLSNLVYAGGTTSKVALWFRRVSDTSQDAGMILATKQAQTTGTTTATKANHLVDSGASFHPGLVHRVVKNTTDSTYTVVVRFVSPTTLEVADDYFVNGEGYAILDVGETIAGIWYSQIGMGLPSDLTLLGEIDSTDSLYPVTLLGRLFLLTGADRGYVLHGKTFRPLGMMACRDNNSLSVDVSQSGSHTGKYKFALVWYDAETYRMSPEYIIEDSNTEDGYYVLSGKKIVLDTGTLPTNTVDTWTHYRLYVKKDEWADYHFGVEVEKTASTFEESETDGTLLARETLAQNRIAPSGFTYGAEWQDRLALWGHHGLEITGGISVSNGSTLVTLGGGVTTDEWMRGARLFMAASGSSPLHGFEIKAIVDSTTLELYFAWDGDTISAGDGRIVPYPSRVVIGLSGYANCEFTSPWHYIDVNPDDGDMVVTCFEHAGDLYVLKRHSMWRLTLDQIIDQLGGEIPTVLITTRKIAEIGCCGPRAIATDGRSGWYWLAGPHGLMRFDGIRTLPAPTDNGKSIKPYLVGQKEEDFWNVRATNNPQWRCIEVHGLRRAPLIEPVPLDGYWVAEDSFSIWTYGADPDNYYIALSPSRSEFVFVLDGSVVMVVHALSRLLLASGIREQAYTSESLQIATDSRNGEIEYDNGAIAIAIPRTSDAQYVKVAELSAAGILRAGQFREEINYPLSELLSPTFTYHYEWFDSDGVLDFTADLLRTLFRFERINIGGITNARFHYGSYRERGV